LTEKSAKLSNSFSDIDLVRKQQLLMAAIEKSEQELLAGIRLYVWKLGLVSKRADVENQACGILQDTVVAAIEDAANYDSDRPASSWLLGIACNQIRRRRRSQAYERLHVVPIGDVLQPAVKDDQASGEDDPGDVIFAYLRRRKQTPSFELGSTTKELLSLVGEDDAKVLKMAYVEGVRGKSLAARLGIGEGAAWSRLSRARKRFREAYKRSGAKKG
jgi:RNA polymerase sigma factor (sigma-70 family)